MATRALGSRALRFAGDVPRYRLPALMARLACEGAGLATGETLAEHVEVLTCRKGADVLASEGVEPRASRRRRVWPSERLARGTGRAAFAGARDAPRGDPLEAEYRAERARERAARREHHDEAAD